MLRVKTVILVFLAILVLSTSRADDFLDQSVLEEINSIFIKDPCESKCTYSLQSLERLCDSECKADLHSFGYLTNQAYLTKLKVDINADGRADFAFTNPMYCGAGICYAALLVSDGNSLKYVFGGQYIAYFQQSTNGFRDLVQGKRGPGQPSYGGTGRIPVYKWNGEKYIESGSVDDQTSSVTSIHDEESSANCIGVAFTVKKESKICEFFLDYSGVLYYKNNKLSEPIVVSSISDGSVSLVDSLIIYPSSPSGRYFYVKACEAGQTPLCWSQWLFDSTQNRWQSTTIGRYGPQPEIYWNTNDKLAALFYTDDGEHQIYILNAETGETWAYPSWSNSIDIDKKTFAWIDSSSFSIDAAICKESKLVPSNCGTTLSNVQKKKTIFKLDGVKLYPSIDEYSNQNSLLESCFKIPVIVLKGQNVCGFLLDDLGRIYHNNEVVSDPIKFYVDRTLADFLVIYPPSPSGIYYFINACIGKPADVAESRCRTGVLYDSKKNKTIQKATAKYGNYPEAYWSQNDHLVALFLSQEDKGDYISIFDAESGKDWQFPDGSNTQQLIVDRHSFVWIDSNSFRVQAKICTTNPESGDCSQRLAFTNTIFKIEGDKLYPSTNDFLGDKSSPSIKITASALGVSSDDKNKPASESAVEFNAAYNMLEIRAPAKIGIEVTFQAFVNVPSNLSYLYSGNRKYVWYVDDELQASSDSSITKKFLIRKMSQLNVKVRHARRDAGIQCHGR